MKPIPNNPTCERGNDLFSFLYHESEEREAREFEKHLKHCSLCESEVASFVQLRESIGTWKHEALSKLASARIEPSFETSKKRSSVAALREFFNLAPLWMKGAVAFATVLFCLFAVLALGRLRMGQSRAVTAGNSNAIYSQEEVEALVKRALEQKAVADRQAVVVPPKTLRLPPKRTKSGQTQLTVGRRPLSKSEREQLAADLRLTMRGDEEGLDLLGDNINQ